MWLNNARLNPEYEEEHAARFDIGTAAHSLFVGAGEETVVIDAPDYRTKAAKEARDRAHSYGATPVLAKDYARVVEMAAVAEREFGANPEFGDLIPAMKREATILWREVGVTCRVTPGLLHRADRDRPSRPSSSTTRRRRSPCRSGLSSGSRRPRDGTTQPSTTGPA